ncbi:calcium binding EGF domain protein, partial [Ancylostoma duodenale]
CECRSGYHGPLCQYRQSTCSRSIELCGPHGHCIDVDTSENDASYKCICDWGYKVSDDKQNPTCVDVDECLDNPCHPGVDCINLPGKFQCTGCPKGYHGNGQICADIDECAADTYPCSTNPRVPCFNTIGSFHCGSCPPGEDGCQKSNSTICRTEGNCMNGGTCKPISGTEYRCLCPEFYYGLHCEQALKITFEAFKDMYGSDVGSTDCSKTPANLTLFDGASDNAPIFATFCGDSSSGKAPIIGEAITMTSSSAMLRYKGTGGSFSIKWETKKRECGYRTNLASGVLVVPQHHMDIVCDWFISAPMEKHIEIDIPSVEMNTGLELNCSANELEVFDGYTSYDAHRIVHICETTNVTTLVSYSCFFCFPLSV